MKRISLSITNFIVLAILPMAIFAQSANCTIEAGKGCGKIQLGMTKSEIKSIFGDAKEDSYTGSIEYANIGLLFQFETASNQVKSIVFIVNPKVWGNEKFNAFNGNLPKNLSFQTSPGQLTQSLANPLENNNYGEVTSIKYAGIEFGFRNNILMYVEVNKNGSISPADVEEETLTSEEAKKQKEKLDSLKSNITFDSTPSPSPKSTPTPKPVSAQNGSLADCKQILSDACRNFLLYSNIADVAPALGLIKQSAEKYSKSGLTVYVEPTSGGIVSVRIFKDSGWQPSNNLKFGEKMSKVKEKYPNGEYENGRYYDDYLAFPNYTLGFEKGKLWVVELKRDRTDLEETAKRTRDAEIRRQEAEAEANKTPEQRAKEMLAIYQSFHDRIEAKVKRHNDLAAELKDPVVNAFPSMFYARKEEMSKIKIEIPKMIDDFLTKYAGQLSQAMINHLNEDLEKLRSGRGH